MCEHYVIKHPPAQIAPYFRCDPDRLQAPSGEVRPLHQGAVVRLAAPKDRELVPMRWGLVPPWAPDLGFGATATLVGAERLATRRSTRNAARRRRCLVPASAFIERKFENGQMQQVHAARHDGSPFGFAGLWESWPGPDGEIVETFAIVSVAGSNARPRGVPVILDPRDFPLWLDPDRRHFDRQMHLLKPFDDRLLCFEPIQIGQTIIDSQRLCADRDERWRLGSEIIGRSAILRAQVKAESGRLRV